MDKAELLAAIKATVHAAIEHLSANGYCDNLEHGDSFDPEYDSHFCDDEKCTYCGIVRACNTLSRREVDALLSALDAVERRADEAEQRGYERGVAEAAKLVRDLSRQLIASVGLNVAYRTGGRTPEKHLDTLAKRDEVQERAAAFLAQQKKEG